MKSPVPFIKPKTYYTSPIKQSVVKDEIVLQHDTPVLQSDTPILEELIDFGISRYKENFSMRYQDTDLVLYQK